MRIKQTTTTLTVYSITHLIVDAACILLIVSGIYSPHKLSFFIVLYNVLAFGLQAPFGWLSDITHKPKLMSILGCIFVIAGLYFFKNAMLATIFVGTGNALFHVGGGSIALNLREKKAALPGVFVSTGAIGLFLGGLYGKTLGYHPHFFAAALFVCVIGIMLLKPTTINYKKEKLEIKPLLLLAITLLLITVVIRSTVGLSLNFSWKSNMLLLVFFTISIACGKAFGGFLSDKWGWMKVTITGLSISALLLYFGAKNPACGIIGIFLFNFSMPVTLVAISNLLPGRPGFSFGLTTVALIVGAIPTFGYKFPILSESFTILVLIAMSVIIVFFGLKYYFLTSSGSTKSRE